MLQWFCGLVILSVVGAQTAPCTTVTGSDGKVVELCGDFFTVKEDNSQIAKDMNVFWILVCGILVFFMQAGFSMLESGCVSQKNVINILFKNVMDAGIGAIAFFIFGYAFAYGGEGDNVFIGETNFALVETAKSNDYEGFFFQWAFAATAATIVSGSVAERCKISAYFVYSFVISAFIYPVVVHWVWDSDGWLAQDTLVGPNGLKDFAGSGVVHMVGGFSGLMGAIACGPRLGTFTPATDRHGRTLAPQEHNQLIATLGVIILWVGWYGFNCGSTLEIAGGSSALAAKVAVTTTLSAASGMIVCMLVGKLTGHKQFSLLKSLNGVLAGLVAITAGCNAVEPWAAIVIGVIGGLVYIFSSRLLKCLKIDDPLDASPIHGFCGFWGVLAVGIFGTDENISQGANDAVASGSQFATQLIGGLVIASWTVITSGVMFFAIKAIMGIRVPKENEELGMDASEHGGSAYTDVQMTTVKKTPSDESKTSGKDKAVAATETTKNENVTIHVDNQ